MASYTPWRFKSSGYPLLREIALSCGLFGAFSIDEKEIEKLEKRKEEIHELFLDTSKTPEELTELTKELDALQEKLDDREEKWMEMADFV